MKFSTTSLLTLSAIAAFSLLLTTSCKKSNSSSGGGGLTATVSGTAWATTVPTQAIYSKSVGEFQIVGGQYKSGDSTGISVAFGTPFPLHTAFSSDTAFVDVEYVNVKTLAQYDGGLLSGHSIITVSSWDSVNHKIVGTYSGVLYNTGNPADSLVVTNGTFSTAYTAEP
jgi:hypothetical protein